MSFKIFYGWWIVAACFFIAFYVSSVIFYGFTVFFEPLVSEFGWSYTQVSFASSLRGLEMGILAPLIGMLVDRFGSRKLLLAGTVAVGMGLLLMSTTKSLLMFYAAMVLISFGGGGCTSLVTMTAIAQWFKKNIGKALGVMSAGFGASGLMLPLIVWCVDAYGWRTALVILGVGMWIVGVPLALVVRDSPEPYGYLPDGETIDDTSFPRPPRERSRIRIWDALRERNLLCLNLLEGLRFMVLASVVIHIMPHLSTLGIPRTTAGVIAAAIPLISIIGRFVFGWLGDVFDKRYVMLLAFSFMAIGVFLLPFIDAPLWLVLFFVLFPAGLGGLSVLRGTILREYYDAHTFGTRMGLMMGFAAGGGIIGPTLTGWIFDVSGSYQMIWLGFSIVLLLSLGLIPYIRPRPVTDTR